MGEMYGIYLNMKTIDASWHSKIAELKCPQKNRASSIEFTNLIDLAIKTNDQEVIRSLFFSLSDDDCGGVEQSVYGVLGTVPINTYYSVLCQEISNLISILPKRTVQLLDFTGYDLEERQVKEICDEILLLYPKSANDTIKKICNVIRSENYLNDFPYNQFYNHLCRGI